MCDGVHFFGKFILVDIVARRFALPKRVQLPPCPIETVLLLLCDKWKVLILRDLLSGTKRFGELKKSLVGISQKVLTQHLRALEQNGIVRRKVFAEVPPKVEYSLSDIGHSLKPIHDAMWKWGKDYQAKAGKKL
jgi:DNA-binding HxlR family transcriptional regulator